jgi:hypothetical protein
MLLTQGTGKVIFCASATDEELRRLSLCAERACRMSSAKNEGTPKVKFDRNIGAS